MNSENENGYGTITDYNKEQKERNTNNDVKNETASETKKEIKEEIAGETKIEIESDKKNNENSQNSKENKTKTTAKKILKTISLTIKIITWTLVIIVLSLLIMTVLSRKTDVLGHRIYLIITGSMEPQIHIKDAVFTKQENNLKEGDVIAFEQGNAVTVHRIVKVYTEGENVLYQTKGDANNIVDKGLVQKTQVKGKVIATSTVIGKSVYWLQHNFIVFILIIGILLIILILRRLI